MQARAQPGASTSGRLPQQPALSHRFVVRQEGVGHVRRACDRLQRVHASAEVEQSVVPPAADGTEARFAKQEFAGFVDFARIASPYIEGHRGRTFVVQIPGEVLADRARLVPLLGDIALLHGMGVRLVLVLGSKLQVDRALRKEGREPRFARGYRVTDAAAMRAVLQAASSSVTEVQAILSKAPAVSMVRRHSRSGARFSFRPAISLVTGNYIKAKRRGAMYGAAGKVRFVQAGAVRQQLDAGNIVALTNLGYSAAGELLNCNAYEVATLAALELRADKLVCMTGADVRALALPFWMPLSDAEELIVRHYCQSHGDAPACQPGVLPQRRQAPGSDSDDDAWQPALGSAVGSASAVAAETGVEFDIDDFESGGGLPTAVVAAVAACKNGVKRTHLVDAMTDGSLLIELFSRDGFGTMFSTDLYSGIRSASARDGRALSELLTLLRVEGVVLPPREAGGAGEYQPLLADLADITVLECEGQVVACAWLQQLGPAPDGVQCGEVVACVVHPAFRNAGRGDSLLDYLEQRARERGLRRLVVVTNKAIDWFEQRDFVGGELACQSRLLPSARRDIIDPSGQLQLFSKTIFELDAENNAPAGKRIGY